MKQLIQLGRTKIVVGGALAALEGLLPAGARVIVITDVHLHRRYRELIGRREYILTGTGENNKTLAGVEAIYRELLAMGADRHTFILGIGGGVVTDIAGFVAATWMRGVDFGFISTTLLGQVDAAIGGKNGVNLDGYKNIVGTFAAPRFVLCDTAMLATLPEREMRAGLAEILKAAIIGDEQLFKLLEAHPFDTLTTDPALLRAAIGAAIAVKVGIVERDEREAGPRKLLNLGHTFGHAIEKRSPAHSHGEAVAIGVCLAARLSVRLGLLDEAVCERIVALTERLGLPTASPVEARGMLEAIGKDKKRAGTEIDVVVIRGIGKCEIRRIGFDELGIEN